MAMNTQYTDEGVKAFPINSAIGQYLRVILTAGFLAIAGVTDNDLGVIRDPAFASENAPDSRGVWLRTKQGTKIYVAAGPITQGANIYTAANGQVSATQATGALARGTALTAATQAGDFIEGL